MFKGKKFLPKDNKNVSEDNRLQYIFVAPTTTGETKGFVYAPEKDENGKYIPLTESSFYDGLRKNETVILREVAKQENVPEAILYGVAEMSAPPSAENLPDIKPTTTTFEPMKLGQPAPFKPTLPVSDTPSGPVLPENWEERKRMEAANKVPKPTLYHVSDENKERYKAVSVTNPVVSERNTSASNVEDMDFSFTAAVASQILAEVLNANGFTEVAYTSDKDLAKFYRDYMGKNNKAVTEEETKRFVEKVRSYKVGTYFPASVKPLPKNLKTRAVERYNSKLINVGKMSYDNWWDYRGEAIDVTDVSKYDDSADLLKAVEFFKDPENHFNTVLPEEEEKEFQKWLEKAKEDGYISEADTGIDYDYRGYWREFPKRGREITQNGHFPDRYKKPNHPTFSKESVHARDAWGVYAGSWNGETFEQPRVSYPRAEQLEYLDYLKKTTYTTEEAVYHTGIAAVKQLFRNILPDRFKQKKPENLMDEGTVTGFSIGIDGDSAVPAPEKPIAKFNTAAYPNPELVEYINMWNNGDVVNQTTAVAVEPIQQYAQALTTQKIDALIHYYIKDMVGNWSAYNEDNNVIIKGMDDVPDATKKIMFQRLREKYDSDPFSVVARVSNDYSLSWAALVDESKALEARKDSLSDEEYAQEKRVLDWKINSLRLEGVQMQEAFFVGNTPRVIGKETKDTIVAELNNTSSESGIKNAQDRVTSIVAGNFPMATALAVQLSTDYDNEGTNVERFSKLTPEQAWATSLLGYRQGNDGVNDETYYAYLAVATGTDKYGDVSENSKTAAELQVRKMLGFVEGRLIKTMGTSSAARVREKMGDLVDTLVHLGYAQDSKNFNSSLVQKEVNAIKESFLLPRRHQVVMDRSTASFYNITDEKQLDILLDTAVADAKEAFETGNIAVAPGGDVNARIANEAARKQSPEVFPILWGGSIYFALRNKNGDPRLLYVEGTSQPYVASLKSFTSSERYDSAFYDEFHKNYGLYLTPRPYIQAAMNPDMDILPGRVDRRLRGRTADTLYQYTTGYILPDGVDKVDPYVFLQADQDYHKMLYTLETNINAAGTYRKDNVTSYDVEKRFLENLRKEYDANKDKAAGSYISIMVTPAANRAYLKTYESFMQYEPPLYEKILDRVMELKEKEPVKFSPSKVIFGSVVREENLQRQIEKEREKSKRATSGNRQKFETEQDFVNWYKEQRAKGGADER